MQREEICVLHEPLPDLPRDFSFAAWPHSANLSSSLIGKPILKCNRQYLRSGALSCCGVCREKITPENSIVIKMLPRLAWAALSDGGIDFPNEPLSKYTGFCVA